MFQVLDNGRPADMIEHPILKNHMWATSIFNTFDEAQIYAQCWLGIFRACAPYKPNTKTKYNGMGDTIEIREFSHTLLNISTVSNIITACKRFLYEYDDMGPLGKETIKREARAAIKETEVQRRE